jgi:hypothetical protein
MGGITLEEGINLEKREQIWRRGNKSGEEGINLEKRG